ncbi:IclR family transcriptional regulator [Parafrankia colletiae]|uniref:Glycerol operon regulatory protein n=1 Tax=Parafrankia colletiae TaxID=573497 RepID=A0A1S1QFB0_9ACTN|nr:IclR family transcriptional regulator [Frankia sp. Cpl3]OHV33483.1 IclR family transcriptional regulator [Parafrankia colletiae]
MTDRPAPPAGNAAGTGAVQSVDRALALVELLAASGDGAGLADLARATGLPQPTVHRLLRALHERGWVRQDADRRYAPGARLIGLGNAAQSLLATGAQPYLREAVAVSGETANLAVLEADQVVYVAQVASPHRLRMFTEVGNRAPAHSTGVGKAMLAHLPGPAVRELLERTGLPRRTATTITDPDQFTAELAAVRARGYATDDGEEEPGVRCVAFPLTDLSGRAPAALSVSGPASRIAAGAVADLAARLLPVAAACGDHLLRR